MKGSQPGELEELVLLTVASLYDSAYGVAIQEELRKKGKRSVALSTIHITLFRLERKGWLHSRFDGATPERGGRRKHMYRVTNSGYHAIERVRRIREGFWSTIPGGAFNGKMA
jgi:DNA-binding PadR family transcriptional regulator